MQKLLSKPEVLARVGVTFPTIWAWMRAGEFPKPIQLPGNRRVAWLEDELDEWLKGRPRQIYKK